LRTKLAAEPYPIDALPDSIRLAVQEVEGFVKAPLAMVAGSALASISLAAQAHIDVERADRLCGPTGLFFLTIADSGERKTTCDSFFSQPISAFEAAKRIDM
jgi:putative DNA primase/helicase